MISILSQKLFFQDRFHNVKRNGIINKKITAIK